MFQRQQDKYTTQVFSFFEAKFTTDTLRVLEDTVRKGKASREKKRKLSSSAITTVTGELFPPSGSPDSPTNDDEDDDENSSSYDDILEVQLREEYESNQENC
jgi:hypothetical protein